jgi:hypothetical protein
LIIILVGCLSLADHFVDSPVSSFLKPKSIIMGIDEVNPLSWPTSVPAPAPSASPAPKPPRSTLGRLHDAPAPTYDRHASSTHINLNSSWQHSLNVIPLCRSWDALGSDRHTSLSSDQGQTEDKNDDSFDEVDKKMKTRPRISTRRVMHAHPSST